LVSSLLSVNIASNISVVEVGDKVHSSLEFTVVLVYPVGQLL
jgi:hypothetical protein